MEEMRKMSKKKQSPIEKITRATLAGAAMLGAVAAGEPSTAQAASYGIEHTQRSNESVDTIAADLATVFKLLKIDPNDSKYQEGGGYAKTDIDPHHLAAGIQKGEMLAQVHVSTVVGLRLQEIAAGRVSAVTPENVEKAKRILHDLPLGAASQFIQ
ncbi:hypothetical protein HYT05_02150 [Candidatus Kaiserbacteria bacterium]|nr:hypothetical protein [Candidatus Kaiserbacteria bacterium]